MNLLKIYQDLKHVQATPAVSIFVPTHRTFPDNEQDSIAVKNALSELENRLLEQNDKRTTEGILDQINQKLEGHNHNYNLDSLAIFATLEEAHILKLPFQTASRVVIDERYALREFIRELNNGQGYYLLAVNRDQARLIEAYNDQVNHEFDHSDELQNSTFPIQYDNGAIDRNNDTAEENAFKEYLNRVDKSVQEVYNQNNLPVFIVADPRTSALYEQVCDNKRVIAATVNSNQHQGSAQDLVNDIQEHVHQHRQQQQIELLDKIGQARGQNQLLEDFTQIYAGTVEGRIKELFVRKGYVQPAKVDAEKLQVQVTDEEDRTTDDLIDDLIELTLQNGGDVHFIASEHFPENANLFATTRY